MTGFTVLQLINSCVWAYRRLLGWLFAGEDARHGNVKEDENYYYVFFHFRLSVGRLLVGTNQTIFHVFLIYG